MLSPANPLQVVVLESSSQARILTKSESPDKPLEETRQNIPPLLSYANFVMFVEQTILLWGGGSSTGDTGILLVGTDLIVSKRTRAKPLQCRIIDVENVQEKTSAIKEIWVLWSDGVITSVEWRGPAAQLDYKRHQKYFTLDQVPTVNDFIVLGSSRLLPSVLDYRRPQRQIIVAGSSPGLATIPIMQADLEPGEGGTGRQLLAVAAASALTSAVASLARRWFAPGEAEDEKSNGVTGISTEDNQGDDEQAGDEVTKRIVTLRAKMTFEDNREFTSLSSGKRFCAAADTLGRIFVFDALTLCVTRVLKGYRSPQMCFQTLQPQSMDALLVLAPLSRGNFLEVWRANGFNDHRMITKESKEKGEEGSFDSRPFRSARISQVPADGSAQLVMDYTGQRCALLIPESRVLVEVDVNPHLKREPGGATTMTQPLPQECEDFVQMLRSNRKSGTANLHLDVAPASVLVNLDAVLEHIHRRFEKANEPWLSIEFLSDVLKRQKTFLLEQQGVVDPDEAEKLLKKSERRLGVLSLLERFSHKAQQQQISSSPMDLKVDESLPRRWALELSSRTSYSLTSIQSLPLVSLLVGDTGPFQMKSIFDLLFYPLLVGTDVFVVRELVDALPSIEEESSDKKSSLPLLKGLLLLEDVVKGFVNWFLSAPVERSAGWRNPPQSNPLLRFTIDSKMVSAKGAHYQESLMDTLRSTAKGRLGLARAALLCRGLSDCLKNEEAKAWRMEESRFVKAFDIAVQLFADEEADGVESSFSVASVDDFGLLRRLITDRCIDFSDENASHSLSSNSALQSPTPSSVVPRWKRSPFPLTILMSENLLGKDLFGSDSARDEFRLEVARKALSAQKFYACAQTLKAFEDLSSSGAVSEYEQVRRDLCIAVVESFGRSEMVDQSLVSLLKSQLRGQQQKHLVEILLLAKMLNDEEESRKMNELLIKSLQVEALKPEEVVEKETMDGDARRIAEKLFADHLRQAVSTVDDESLRVLARRIGLTQIDDGESALNSRLCLLHLAEARDERSRECFGLVTGATWRRNTAKEMLRMCRVRMAALIRSARADKRLAGFIASVSPKTMAWLLATPPPIRATSKKAGDDPSPPTRVDVPVQSTLSILSLIVGELGESSSAEIPPGTSDTDRCAQLLALCEDLIMAASQSS